MCPRVSILEEREKARQSDIWKPAEYEITRVGTFLREPGKKGLAREG